jgi:hypothetical protein
VGGEALNRYGQRLTVNALDAFDVHELDGAVELEGVLYTSSELQREPPSLAQLRARVLEGSQSQALGRLRMPWARWVPVAPGDSFGVASFAEFQLEAEPASRFVTRRLSRPFAEGEDVMSLTQFTEAGIAREVLPEVAPQAAKRLR